MPDQSETQYTHTSNGRTWKLYGCAKDGCDAVNPDYLSCGVGERSYCLHHIPLRYRRLRVQAALHETRCRQCRVTWRSWLARLLGVGGMSPKPPKKSLHRPLDNA